MNKIEKVIFTKKCFSCVWKTPMMNFCLNRKTFEGGNSVNVTGSRKPLLGVPSVYAINICNGEFYE